MRLQDKEHYLVKRLNRIEKELLSLQRQKSWAVDAVEKQPYLRFVGDVVKFQDKSGEFLQWYIHSFLQDKEEETTRVMLVSIDGSQKHMFVYFDTLDNTELIDMIEKRIEFL